jgi:diadenosine tetraphosphatase ApaH/serine/threonine PP2A family protein phosphatase
LESSELEYFNHIAKQAIQWTIPKLSEESILYLEELPFSETQENFLIVHANPVKPPGWDYVLSIELAILNFSFFENQICFIGHSHTPLVFVETEDKNYLIRQANSLKLQPGERYIINVGSVGQPRDSNPNAAYGILDTDKCEFNLFRIPYPIQETQAKMLKYKLPKFLIDRLENGR